LGLAEVTEYDAHLENLIQKADRTKYWTERIVSQTETVLQPNPSTCCSPALYVVCHCVSIVQQKYEVIVLLFVY